MAGPAWLAARAAVVAAYALGRIAVDQLGTARPAPLLDGIMAWDAHHYRTIAESGYDALADGYRFFPLFPMAVRGLSVLTLGNETAAAVVLANTAALALGVVLYRHVLAETADPGVSRLATWLLLAGPAAAPLVMGYAESLGTLFAVLAFAAARRRRWGVAAAAGAALGATWSVGWLITVPLVIEAARGVRATGLAERARRALAVVAPGAVTAGYLGWVELVTGDGWGNVVRVQTATYDRTLRDPITSLVVTGTDLVAGHQAKGVAFVWAVVAIALVVVAFRHLPASYGAYGLATFLVAFSADNVDSFERYLLRAFPLVMAAALVLRREWQQRMAISIGLSGLTVYAAVIFLGAEVP